MYKKTIILLVLLRTLSSIAQEDVPMNPKNIIKVSQVLFENDFIKFRQFSIPYLAYERDMEDGFTFTMSLKYNFYNYKNETHLPTNNYYKYFGLINRKIILETGIRWYALTDDIKTFGRGLFVPALLSLGHYKSDNDFSPNDFSYFVPAVGVGLGYQNFLTEKISYEIEVLFKKGFKATYLNGTAYREPDRNYNNLGLRASIGYKF